MFHLNLQQGCLLMTVPYTALSIQTKMLEPFSKISMAYKDGIG